MNTAPSASRLPPYLESAIQRVRMAARSAAERTVDSLGLAALSSNNIVQRDVFLGAQFELNRKLAIFALNFNDTLDKRVGRDVAALSGQVAQAATDWDALSLVDDREVENQVSAERFALEIQHECEAELRELDGFIGAVLKLDTQPNARNPLRPEMVGLALMRAVDSVATDRPDARKVLATEVGRSLAAAMRQTYLDITADLRNVGVQPITPSLRPVRQSGHGRHSSSYDNLDSLRGHASSTHSTGGGALGAYAGPGGPRGAGGGGAAPSGGHGAGGQGHAQGMNAMLGQVDPRMMSLMRQLAHAHLPDSGPGGLHGGFADSAPAEAGAAAAPNLIVAHREELRRLASGSLDHMVIDVVGGLFDQILADAKVPPQMARQIARLQLPVLRAALGDPSFFSSRRHPVRRFVNRIASLACAYDDFGQADAQAFLALVKDLVQEIVEGDFDHIEVYEARLDKLESFAAEQARREVRAEGAADELLARKETELRVQQHYSTQLQAALEPVPVDEFLRDFLSQTWSSVLTRAAHLPEPVGPALSERFRRAGRELVMSVQPKGSPAQRKTFLLALPQLMKDLNAGMDLVRLSEGQRKAFFARLLPAHAESLKGRVVSTLDHNLLLKQVEQVMATPLPKAAELPVMPVAQVAELPGTASRAAFSDEEAMAVGLLDEASVDWDGQVDIAIDAEPAPSAVDLQIDGLPEPEPAEPSSGKTLADHVQIGFAYQLHQDGAWHKVRLAHMSPGRSFFVFTRGGKHKRTISMTYRMLTRLCETGRMRAFESGYLIERATARARRQLARMKAEPAAAAAA